MKKLGEPAAEPQRPARGDRVRGLAAEVRDVLERLRQLHLQLAEDPDPGGDAVSELLRLRAQEDIPADEHDGDEQAAEEAPVLQVVPPADATALRALASRGLTAQWSRGRSRAAETTSLRHILNQIGRPRQVRTEDQMKEVIATLDAATGRIDSWISQPQSVQQALLGLLSSLARHVQDEYDGLILGEPDELLRASFPRLTRFSREHRPGFVPGLSRKNDPDGASWFEDATEWWRRAREDFDDDPSEELTPEEALTELEDALAEGVDTRKALTALVKKAIDAGVAQSDPRLVSLLTPHQSLLRGAGGMKTLKTALKDALKAEEEDEDTSVPIPKGWPFLERTRGKQHAVIVGGDPRPAARDRICEAFSFAEVEWESSELRRLNALAARIRRGSVDVVLLLSRFIGHRHQEVIKPACYETGVPLAMIDSGYGVTQARLALEKGPGAVDLR